MRRKFIVARCAYLLFTIRLFLRCAAALSLPTYRPDDHLHHTIRETMLIGPPRGVVKRETTSGSQAGRSVSTLNRPLVGRRFDGNEDEDINPCTHPRHVPLINYVKNFSKLSLSRTSRQIHDSTDSEL